MSLMIGENWILRIKSLLVALPLLATAIITHTDLLPFSRVVNNSIELGCFIILAFNNPIAGRIQERKPS